MVFDTNFAEPWNYDFAIRPPTMSQDLRVAIVLDIVFKVVTVPPLKLDQPLVWQRPHIHVQVLKTTDSSSLQLYPNGQESPIEKVTTTWLSPLGDRIVRRHDDSSWTIYKDGFDKVERAQSGPNFTKELFPRFNVVSFSTFVYWAAFHPSSPQLFVSAQGLGCIKVIDFANLHCKFRCTQ
jgi:hypothetical protein